MLFRRLRTPLLGLGPMAAVLALVLACGLLPAAALAAAPTTDPAAALQPTVQYEEALAHANDRIAFRAGARVSVPFRPRAGDSWVVDGARPRALPAGSASGKVLRDAPNGPTPIQHATAPRVDAPTIDPATVIAADGATWSSDAGLPTFELAAAVDPGALRREVFGFLPYWELSDSSTTLDWEKISTVAYFGVGADSTGNLIKKDSTGKATVGWSGWTSSKMTSVIDAAHASHARVVLTVQSFAWTSTGLARQKKLLGSAAARTNLATQIASAVRARGADGVNLDFEPIASGYADEFTLLVRSVRSSLKAIAKGYQLTFDTTGWIGNYPIEAATAKGGADAVVVMGYDYRSSSSSPVGSIAPIGGPTYDIRDTLQAYVARIPASKVILGVPYYGRAWSTSSKALHAKNISGTKNGASVTVPYSTARGFGVTYGKAYDPVEGVAWTAYRRENCTTTYGCVNPWRQLYFDDAKALKAKYDLVNQYGLRGAGIWALGYDGTRPELYEAIKAKFITDTIPPTIKTGSISSGLVSPNGDGRLDTTTATLTASGLTTWGYRVAPVSGSTIGAAVRSGSQAGKSPAFTWDGRDQAGAVVADGRYRLTLWTADASNNRAERGFDVTVDRTAAAVTSAASRGYFSPDGDGHQDTLPLSWSANEALTGVVRLRNAAGTSVRSWSFTKRTSWKTAWTGRTRAGAFVPAGRYTFLVKGRDRAGNLTQVTRTILVDGTIAAVRWTHRSFDPRARQTSRVVIAFRRAAKIDVAIYQGGTLVRTIWTNRSVKSGTYHWTWTGKTAAGTYVKPGVYKVTVTARSKFGTTRFSRSVTVQVH
jgi:spore germination protein YaaH/flagellar hook assembly protein FlgD